MLWYSVIYPRHSGWYTFDHIFSPHKMAPGPAGVAGFSKLPPRHRLTFFPRWRFSWRLAEPERTRLCIGMSWETVGWLDSVRSSCCGPGWLTEFESDFRGRTGGAGGDRWVCTRAAGLRAGRKKLCFAGGGWRSAAAEVLPHTCHSAGGTSRRSPLKNRKVQSLRARWLRPSQRDTNSTHIYTQLVVFSISA